MAEIIPSEVFKALSDQNRLRIVELLYDGELCACKLLEEMNFTQPTLSHHMGILMKAGIVNGRKEGKWVYYTVNTETMEKASEYLRSIFRNDAV